MDPSKNGVKKAPYKRILTDKRRSQNRAAQKIYRAKRKERLEFLEQAVAATQANIQDDTQGIDPTSIPIQPLETPINSDTLVISPLTQIGNRTAAVASSNSPSLSLIEVNPLRDTVSIDDIISLPDLENNSIPLQTNTVAWENPNYDTHLLNTADGLSGITAPFKYMKNDHNPSNSSSSDILAIKGLLQAETECDTSELIEFAISKQLNLKNIILAGLRTLKSNDDLSNTNAVMPIPSSITLPLPISPISQSSNCSLANIGAVFPDLYNNNIFLENQKLHEVYYQNARRIGLSLEQLMRSHTPSPFCPHLPIGPCSASVMAPFPSSIPPDLRPTPAQISFPHHPFLDLIPFPWFRDRVISLSALDPPPFDRFELKKDILSGGLTCWKSRGSSTGQPWDRRSWEAEPWFLNKWGWLVEDGGKVESMSKWWRRWREE